MRWNHHLAVFFTALSYFKQAVRGPGVVSVTGFIRDGKWVNVHLSAGRTLQRVRFVGFTDSSSAKGGAIPFQLSSMAVLESAQGLRTFVRADSIKMIEEVGDAA